MTTRWTPTRTGMSALAATAFLLMTFAHQAAAGDNDPPGRVARLSHISGVVSFQPAGESDWVPAVVNWPITSGDRLWVDDRARAELHLGSATIRLNAGTGVSFFNLDDRGTQIELSEGTLNIRITRLDRDEDFEIDTPNQAFSILSPGEYRIEASEDGESTLVTVRAGAGEATGSGRTYRVGAGQTGRFTGTDLLRASVYRAGGNDEFDEWCRNRDRRDDGSPSARYVSRDVVGYQDLDDYGSWTADANYGNVWMPRVPSGWAPYHDGHWVWISPWGWTWVDEAPWGYAPFHYGRWVYVGSRWGWVPGPIAVRPVYAPALVAFIGGTRFSVSVSVGNRGGYGENVGWFPLGPREVYVPAYRTSREYVDRVNITNTTVTNTTITNVYNNTTNVTYVNRSVQGGVTAVSRDTFANSQPVGRAVVAVSPQEVAAAPISRKAEVVPTSNSVFGSSAPRGSQGGRPSARAFNRPVVAKTAPPPPPVSFERQQQRLAAQPGQPLASTEVEGLRPADASPRRSHVKQAPPGRAVAAESTQPQNQPAAVAAPVPTPADVGTPRSPNDAPPARNDRPNERNRRQPADVQPAAPPSANEAAKPPANEAPPTRNDRPNARNRRQPADAQPERPPAVNEIETPPADSDRPDRPDAATTRGKAADKPADAKEPPQPREPKAKKPSKEPPSEPTDDKTAQEKRKKNDRPRRP